MPVSTRKYRVLLAVIRLFYPLDSFFNFQVKYQLMKKSLILILFISLSGFSEEKARNDDLRGTKLTFAIIQSENSISLKSDNGSYFFDKDHKENFRLTTELAKEFEVEFSSLFLSFKYELEKSKEECKLKTVLHFLGEVYTFCDTDQIRTKTLQLFIAKLNKYLK